MLAGQVQMCITENKLSLFKAFINESIVAFSWFCIYFNVCNVKTTLNIFDRVGGAVWSWYISVSILMSFCFRLSISRSSAAMTEFWLISAPGEKTCQQTWDKLMTSTTRTNNLSTNNKFNIPDLKVTFSSSSSFYSLSWAAFWALALPISSLLAFSVICTVVFNGVPQWGSGSENSFVSSIGKWIFNYNL